MEVTLYTVLNRKRQQILSKWQSTSFSSYPHHESLSGRQQSDRFANPIVYVIEKNTVDIVDWLFKANKEVDISVSLEEICRLAAVQDTKPAEALAFLFSLKQIIRDVIVDENEVFYWADELWEIDNQIDKLGLLAFNIYSDCRSQIDELRMNEIKRMYGRDVG